MRIGAIIQARMGSTRLPGKIMLNIHGKTVLEHVIERVKQSKLIDEIIIATTCLPKDDVVVKKALEVGTKVYRGSEEDVLARYFNAAKENNLDIIIRITSDCPLVDPIVLDQLIDYYLSNDYDIVSNAGSDPQSRTYPRGLDIEVFHFGILELAFTNAKEEYQREHVTPYIYETCENIVYYKNDIDYSKYRLTLDTVEDFELISLIYKDLYNGVHNFYLNDIINLLENKPELYEINANVEQKKLS